MKMVSDQMSSCIKDKELPKGEVVLNNHPIMKDKERDRKRHLEDLSLNRTREEDIMITGRITKWTETGSITKTIWKACTTLIIIKWCNCTTDKTECLYPNLPFSLSSNSPHNKYPSLKITSKTKTLQMSKDLKTPHSTTIPNKHNSRHFHKISHLNDWGLFYNF